MTRSVKKLIIILVVGRMMMMRARKLRIFMTRECPHVEKSRG